MTTNKINAEQIRKHIEKNLENWIYAGKHIHIHHVNATEEELRNRLNHYDRHSGKVIHTASTFIDSNNGDDVYEGVMNDLLSQAYAISRWLTYNPESRYYFLRFPSLPYKVTGIVVDDKSDRTRTADSYLVILDKEQKPFRVANMFPEYAG